MKELFGMLLSGLLFVSCAPMTPQARIAAEPQKFAALPAKDQALVRQGLITRGMSKDGVTLAWGIPSRTFNGYDNSKRSESWDYTAARPIYTANFFGGYGLGPGIYRSSYGLGPEVAYVPYRVATVRFRDDRVSSWERLSGSATY